MPLSESAIVEAAEIYADLYRRGQLIGDADILIAAVALANNLALASNNAAHFARISGLRIESWT
jgi:tRNA(fMet)-specific endonuclease VapC